MKLKLVALAVAAVASAAASAQTANVTLYGAVDTFIASTRATDGTASPGGVGAITRSSRVTSVESGGLSGSRWGVRGSEALGGGLNAVFQLESGFGSDTGALGQGGLLFGRQAYVGVNGGFGSFTLGRQYAPMFYVLDSLDIDGTSTFSVNGNHQLGRPGTLRVNNAIKYATPNMGGATMQVIWGLGESTLGTNAGRTFGANLEYTAGPLYAAIAYADVKTGTASTNRSWTAGAAYDFGVAKLSASYFEEKYPNTSGPKFKEWQIGAGIPFGATTLILNAGQGKLGSGKNTLFNVGADHSLSKRTTAYARYANSNNNADANFDAFVKPAVAGYGSDKSIFAIGMRHRF
jgi:predicted porin